MPRTGRRAARERALSLLYEAEAKGEEPGHLLAGLAVAPDPFVVTLVEGVAQHRDRIDALISSHSRDWTLIRMPAIDRNLMRIAVFELTCRPDTPVGVVIDEAVELAKHYSTEDSGRFVNGVLSAVARQRDQAALAEGVSGEVRPPVRFPNGPDPRPGAAADGGYGEGPG
ncbi:MAG: transcription antitermination factor NusB [Acidimicrobiales bacterium]